MIETKTSLTRLYRGARIAVAATALLVMLGCDNDKDVDPPAELTQIKATRDVHRDWSVGLGGDSERMRLALRPNGVDGVVYRLRQRGDGAGPGARCGETVGEYAGGEILARIGPSGIHQEVSSVTKGTRGRGVAELVQRRNRVFESESEAPGGVDQEGSIDDSDRVGKDRDPSHFGRQQPTIASLACVQHRAIEADHLVGARHAIATWDHCAMSFGIVPPIGVGGGASFRVRIYSHRGLAENVWIPQ